MNKDIFDEMIDEDFKQDIIYMRELENEEEKTFMRFYKAEKRVKNILTLKNRNKNRAKNPKFAKRSVYNPLPF